MNDDDLGEALRGALHREAEQIDAAPGDYQRLQERIATRRGRPRVAAWTPWLAAAAAVVTVAGLSGVWREAAPRSSHERAFDAPAGTPAATGTEDVITGRTTATAARRTALPGGATAADPSPTTGPLEDVVPGPEDRAAGAAPEAVAGQVVTQGSGAVPVYWVAAGDRPGFVLYREFVTRAPVTAHSALSVMLRGRPADPDYTNPWRPASSRVRIDGDAIVVDVGAAAFGASVGPELARAALQQLVYTVTAGASLERRDAGTLPVRLLVDGKAGVTVWRSVVLPLAMTRDPDAPAGLWITAPVEGSRLAAGGVTVTVYGTAYEATATWSVLPITDGVEGEEIRRSFVMVGSMGERAEGRFTVSLQPGVYRIRVFEDDPSDGEAAFNPTVPEAQRGDDKIVVVR